MFPLQVRMGGSKNPSVSPSPLRKEQADSSDLSQNWQNQNQQTSQGSNSSGSLLLGGDSGDLVDGSQADDASVINIGEPGTGLNLSMTKFPFTQFSKFPNFLKFLKISKF